MNPTQSSPHEPLTQSQRRWRYAVTATLKDEQAQQRYIDWLFAGHVSEVCHWAEEAEVCVLDDRSGSEDHSQWRVLSIYWFTNQKSFSRYELDGASALRAEGVALAHELGGIDFERAVGWSWMVNRLESLS